MFTFLSKKTSTVSKTTSIVSKKKKKKQIEMVSGDLSRFIAVRSVKTVGDRWYSRLSKEKKKKKCKFHRYTKGFNRKTNVNYAGQRTGH